MDIFCKDKLGYTLSDSYDLVQNVALFLCNHCGEYLDDFLYISAKGKPITIKMECYGNKKAEKNFLPGFGVKRYLIFKRYFFAFTSAKSVLRWLPRNGKIWRK